MGVVLLGVKEAAPALCNIFWDSQHEWGELPRLWGVDILHHWNLGVMKRLGIDQLKV